MSRHGVTSCRLLIPFRCAFTSKTAKFKIYKAQRQPLLWAVSLCVYLRIAVRRSSMVGSPLFHINCKLCNNLHYFLSSLLIPLLSKLFLFHIDVALHGNYMVQFGVRSLNDHFIQHNFLHIDIFYRIRAVPIKLFHAFSNIVRKQIFLTDEFASMLISFIL